jgi:hypothetical protein
VTRESADELMIRRFAGAQRDGIGRFAADPVSGQWSWSDAVYEIFGYPARSVAPSWSLIINHIPEEDCAIAQTAYELATTRVGPLSWSHRIHAGDTMRSILVLGETASLDGVNALKRTGQRSDQPSLRCSGSEARSRTGSQTAQPTSYDHGRARRTVSASEPEGRLLGPVRAPGRDLPICECRCGAPGWRATRLGVGDPM